MKYKRYAVKYNVYYESTGKRVYGVVVALEVRVPTKNGSVWQVASDQASTFLQKDFVIGGKIMNDQTPISIDEIS